jgi:hypothetical protein
MGAAHAGDVAGFMQSSLSSLTFNRNIYL